MSRNVRVAKAFRHQQKAAVLILAGGKGSRLHELVSRDCKPAVPMGGSARMIDFTLANALNSQMTNVIVATQHQPRNLHTHLGSQWSGRFLDAGGRLLVRDGNVRPGGLFKGTAHAVSANIDLIDAMDVDHLVVVAGDHVYQCDYAAFLEDHVRSGATLSVGCIRVPRAMANQFGIMTVREDGRVVAFDEKPATAPGLADSPEECLASAGIYVLDWHAMRDRLSEDFSNPLSEHDFGKDVLPALVQTGDLHAWSMQVPSTSKARALYWRDAGTLESYLDAHLELAASRPGTLMDFSAWPLHVPIDFPGGQRLPFCWINSQGIRGTSFVAVNSRTAKSSHLDRCAISPQSVVEPHVRLTRTIVAPGTCVLQGTVIGEDPEEDAKWFRRSGDVVLVTNDMLNARQESKIRWYRMPQGVTMKPALNPLPRVA